MSIRTKSFALLNVLLLLCAACSGDSNSSRRNNADKGPGQTGTSGVSGLGGSGTTGGGAGNMGGLGTGPLLDPNAPPFMRDDTGAAGLDPGTLDALKAGGGPCAATLLYPYNGTVFPGALPSPVIMWQEDAAAAYVHVVYDNSTIVDYHFAVAATAPGELQIPQDAWDEITRRTGGGKLNVTLNVKIGDSVSTCALDWMIARGNMTGALYYNTYNSLAAAGAGAIMRLTLGQLNPDVYLTYMSAFGAAGSGPCISCHSISHNGTTMVASTHDYTAHVYDVFSYPLQTAPQPPQIADVENGVFGALTPDGRRMLTMGNPECTAGADTFPRASNNFPLVEGPDVARMRDAHTGADIPANGLNPNWYMWMPQFSPDGKHVVFNHAKPDGKGGTDRRELAMMDYDYATNTFSNLKVLVSHLGPDPTLPYNPGSAGAGTISEGRNGCGGGGTPTYGMGNTAPLNPGACEGPCYPAYPFFTSDNRAVIFALNSEPDFANAFPGRDHPSKSDLWYVDVKSGKAIRLDAASDTHDPNVALAEYFPTLMPVPIGGYYWLFWTSRRAYGHKITGLDVNAILGDLLGPLLPFVPGGVPDDANKKRIWVSAISPLSDTEVQAATPRDPSHPGFYLAGQGDSGNVRAFATLNPCKPMGETCTTGLDCCDGFCDSPGPGQPGTCTSQKPTCSKTDERCATDADCCPPTAPDEPLNLCIAGFCGYLLAPD